MFCSARIYIFKSSTNTFEPRKCRFQGKHLIGMLPVCGIHFKRYGTGKKWWGFHDEKDITLLPAQMKDCDPWMYYGKEMLLADDILYD